MFNGNDANDVYLVSLLSKLNRLHTFFTSFQVNLPWERNCQNYAKQNMFFKKPPSALNYFPATQNKCSLILTLK